MYEKIPTCKNQPFRYIGNLNLLSKVNIIIESEYIKIGYNTKQKKSAFKYVKYIIEG
jgi:hypothetical protein